MLKRFSATAMWFQKTACVFGLTLINLFAHSNGFLARTIQEAANQTRQVSAEVRNKLYEQVLSDFPELRQCIEEVQGGVRAYQEGLTAEEHDLNKDGRSEFEVQLSGGCSCGMVNCSIWLYRQEGSKFELILEGSGLGLSFEKTATNGYRDLSIEARDSAFTRAESYYKFDGKQYRETHTNIRDLETGKVKPAYRWVVFKRGTSSATVRGNVTRALSDTHRVIARAGQTMTVQLMTRVIKPGLRWEVLRRPSMKDGHALSLSIRSLK